MRVGDVGEVLHAAKIVRLILKMVANIGENQARNSAKNGLIVYVFRHFGIIIAGLFEQSFFAHLLGLFLDFEPI
jgi:hypothetical protein